MSFTKGKEKKGGSSRPSWKKKNDRQLKKASLSRERSPKGLGKTLGRSKCIEMAPNWKKGGKQFRKPVDRWSSF